MIAPAIEKLAKGYQDRLEFSKLNVDGSRQVAVKYQVMSVPLLPFFRDGKVIDQSTGGVLGAQIQSKIQSALHHTYNPTFFESRLPSSHQPTQSQLLIRSRSNAMVIPSRQNLSALV